MNPVITSSPTLHPVAEKIYQNCRALVPLSPHKGLRNACVIYNVIKNLKDKTLVRGDFNKKSIPYIYFPEKSTRKIIGARLNPQGIAGKTIEAERKELANFINSIADSAPDFGRADHPIAVASLRLKNACVNVEDQGRDFKVKDIKEPLKKLAQCYLMQNLQKVASPHLLLPKQGFAIQDKRLREFANMDRKMFGALADAIRPHSGVNPDYDTEPEMAVFNTKEMFKNYLGKNSSSNKSFADFIRTNGISPYVAYFAKRWLAITLPIPSYERKNLSTEPWAKELDRICPIIIKEQRRTVRILPSVDSTDDKEAQLQFRRTSHDSLPPLPSIIQPSPTNLPPLPSTNQPSSSFVAYTRSDFKCEKESSERGANSKQPQPQSYISPLSPDTPEDEIALSRLIYPSGSLPKFDLNVPYSSIHFGSPSQPSFGIAENPQILPGQLLSTSGHESSGEVVEKTESLTEKNGETDQVTNSLAESFRSASDSFSDFSSQASDDTVLTGVLPKSKAVPATSFSTIALPSVESRVFFSPEHTAHGSFTKLQQADQVSEISSTEEDQ